MKKFITAIAVSTAITAIALAKADKSCWTGSTQVWPELRTFGLRPYAGIGGDGATARIDQTAITLNSQLSKITTSIHGVVTVAYYTNAPLLGWTDGPWKQSITLPAEVLCNYPGNYAQIQMWSYTPQQSFGGATCDNYASAKIQGN